MAAGWDSHVAGRPADLARLVWGQQQQQQQEERQQTEFATVGLVAALAALGLIIVLAVPQLLFSPTLWVQLGLNDQAYIT